LRPDEGRVADFRRAVLSHYAREGRDLPWRAPCGEYGILVSEIMLQQTQVARVLGKWGPFIERFPGFAELADAPLAEVLKEWIGLGYNRRAKALHECARIVARDHGGALPRGADALEELPGIGRYTARAISCFAHGEPEVFIETNIRAAVIHSFFPGSELVRDSEIEEVLELALDREDPKTWYYALMDYGATLKALIANPGRRAAAYRPQSPFKGSAREARGAALRELAIRSPASAPLLAERSGISYERMLLALESLVSEGFVTEDGGGYRLA
jgi:A/G-specific adenine glycosylase